MKNPNDRMGNGTCNIQACSAVPRRRTRNYEVSYMFVYSRKKINYDGRYEELYCDVMSSVGKLPVFWRDLLPLSSSLKKETA
jgi:hypothetical protein